MDHLLSERLELRPWKDEDAEELYRLASDPIVGECCGWSPHHSLEESKRVLHDILKAKGSYAIIRKEDNKLIGTISLSYDTSSARANAPELGYWLGRAYWEHGYMTEAAKLLLENAFQESGIDGVWARHHADNRRSARVLEKLGFTFDHSEHLSKGRDGAFYDDVVLYLPRPKEEE